MPDEQPIPDLARAQYISEEGVLELLLGDDRQRPWTMHELILEIGDRVPVEDAINNLHGAGLVHKTSDDFVLAARPAIYYHQITR
jgi:hypothetical protein